MIDIEGKVMTLIHDTVTPYYPTAKFETTLNLSPSAFPCVCVEEINNTNRISSQDSGSNERHADVAYEVNILTNDASGKKATAKDICRLIDAQMLDRGFNRTTYIPNGLDNGTKYRLLVRYQATVGKDYTIFRR